VLWPRPPAPWISSQLCKRFEATTLRLWCRPNGVDQPTTTSVWHDTLALARSHRLTSDDAAYLDTLAE